MGRAAWWFGAIFGGVGLIFAVVGFGMIISGQIFASRAVQTTGTVIQNLRSTSDDGVSYKPLVEFHDRAGRRREFAGAISTSWRAYNEGEAVTVLFDPADPDTAAIDSATERYFLPGIFAAMGTLFVAVGGGVIAWRVRRISTVARLFHQGTRIEADVVGCSPDTSMRINGRSPYRVHAQARHPATGLLASFRSDPIWLDLSTELSGAKVPILIDPGNPEAYYVDLAQWVHEDEFA
ncbi:MAG: DUF3592 domain-containing protein [Erythrobacter sp.]|jgi:hypothetical protein|nr:DUF3592 domain-containing protein [Erythrobacter sp.]